MTDPAQSVPTAGSPSRSGRPRTWLLAVFLFALATRLLYALQKSLVLDEFHSYFHATAANLTAFKDGLWQDNHPPLSFLIIGAAQSALGTAEWALRSPALLFGLLDIAVVASLAGALARRAEATIPVHAKVFAAALVASSTLHLDYGTQARMYALHGLCITVVTYALITLLARDEGSAQQPQPPPQGALAPPAAAFAFAALAAFHNHYFAVQYVALLSAVFVAVALRRRKRLALRAFSVASAAAFLAALPWALTGLRHQVAHALPPGGDDLHLRGLVQAFVQLFFHNVSFAGDLGRWAFVGGAALAFALALRGLFLCLGHARLRDAGLLLGAAGFALPIVSWALALALPRAGFTWHYVLPSAAAVAVLFGLGVRGRAAAAAGALVLALAAALVGLHLTHPATEDFRGAVAYALQRAEPKTASEVVRVVSVEWQPALFPQGQPYDYYAPRLANGTPPLREPMQEGEFTVQSLARLRDADRVVIVRRSLPADQHLVRELVKTHDLVEVTPFGYGVDVRVFRRRGSAAR